MTHLLTSLLLALAVLVPATATTIDFDAQAIGHGANFTGIPNSPLTIGIATFTGGELLNGEAGLNADQTGVYASQGLIGSGETNPLVITFASPVNSFSVLVVNGDDARSYTVSDNLGDSATISLASAGSLGAGTFSLPGNGLTTVDITSANTGGWDFAIDNVTFTTATSAPEPQSWLLLGLGVVVLTVLRKSKSCTRLLNLLWQQTHSRRD